MPTMTTADLLARAEALQKMPADRFDSARAASLLQELTEGLSAQLRAEAAKSTGSASAVRIAAAMMKKNDCRTALQYAWNDEAGRQCFTDGFRAFRLVKPLPLPARPENVGDPIDLRKIFPADASEWYEVDLPAAAELRAYIQQRTAEKKAAGESTRGILYSFGTAAPTVDARFLLDLVSILPDAKTIKYKSKAAVLYAQGAAGDAVILPVRVADWSEEGRAETAAADRAYKAIKAGEAVAFDDFAAALLSVRPA